MPVFLCGGVRSRTAAKSSFTSPSGDACRSTHRQLRCSGPWATYTYTYYVGTYTQHIILLYASHVLPPSPTHSPPRQKPRLRLLVDIVVVSAALGRRLWAEVVLQGPVVVVFPPPQPPPYPPLPLQVRGEVRDGRRQAVGDGFLAEEGGGRGENELTHTHTHTH